MVYNTESVPKVSIIIPTYNRGAVITRAIDSVLGQTYKNIEIIVIDDGSTDSTQSIISQRYPDSLIYQYQTNRGAGTARNIGFTLSTGEYINFLDSDDYFLPENIASKVEALRKNPEVGWVFSDRYFINEKKSIFSARIPFLQQNREKVLQMENFFAPILLTGGKPITTNTALIRRECITSVGGWDETLPALQDVDFFLRISKLFRGKYIDRADIVQIQSSDSLIADITKRYEATKKLIEKINSEHGPYIFQNRLHWKWRKWQADFFNRYALRLSAEVKRKEAIVYFKRSIGCYPFQKSVYAWLLRSVF